MGPKHLQKSLIPKTSTTNITTTYINKDAASLCDFSIEGNEARVMLSLLHVQHEYQCFSDWSKTEMKDFWRFNSNIHLLTWTSVYSTARKKEKTGLAYTIIDKDQYPDSEFKRRLSKDITLFELRVNHSARAHGFRDNSIFYLCWLDRNHEITSK